MSRYKLQSFWWWLWTWNMSKMLIMFWVNAMWRLMVSYNIKCICSPNNKIQWQSEMISLSLLWRVINVFFLLLLLYISELICISSFLVSLQMCIVLSNIITSILLTMARCTRFMKDGIETDENTSFRFFFLLIWFGQALIFADTPLSS